MEKVLAFENQPMIKAVTDVYNTAQVIAQKVYDNYKSLNLGSLDMASLRALVEHPHGFITNKIADTLEVPTYGGMKMKREAFMDTLELPNYQPVVTSVNDFNYYVQFREVKNLIHGSDVLSCFEIKGNKIQINETELQTRLDGFRIFAINDKQNKLLDGLNSLVAAYKNFDKMVMEATGSRLKDYKPCVFLKDPLAPELQMNENFYQQITALLKN